MGSTQRSTPSQRSTSSQRSTLVAYLELVRLPNVFTSMADVVMGFLFTHAIFTHAAWTLADGSVFVLLIGASTSLYTAGMVLNDLFDHDQDTRERPERPLPSGRISLAAARRLGWGLLTLGVVLGWTAAGVAGDLRPGLIGTLLATCVVLYDGPLKSTPLGPPAMGGCRMLNVLLGMSASVGPWHAEHWLVAAAVGTYIAGVTWLGRTEARRSRRVHLAFAAVTILAGIGLLSLLPRVTPSEQVVSLLQNEPRRWDLLMLMLAGLIGFRSLRAVVEPLPTRVQMVVRQSILTLVLLDAAACFVVCGMPGALAVLVLLLPATLLAHSLRST